MTDAKQMPVPEDLDAEYGSILASTKPSTRIKITAGELTRLIERIARLESERDSVSDRERELISLLLQCYGAATGKTELTESVDFNSIPGLVSALKEQVRGLSEPVSLSVEEAEHLAHVFHHTPCGVGYIGAVEAVIKEWLSARARQA